MDWPVIIMDNIICIYQPPLHEEFEIAYRTACPAKTQLKAVGERYRESVKSGQKHVEGDTVGLYCRSLYKAGLRSK